MTRFMVHRTSQWHNEAPCKEAVRGPYTRVDERYIKTPEEFGRRTGEDWFASGQNHRKKGARIRRDFPSEAWFVEINSLEALLKFQRKYGRLVLGGGWFESAEGYPEIEIYDDYRE